MNVRTTEEKIKRYEGIISLTKKNIKSKEEDIKEMENQIHDWEEEIYKLKTGNDRK